MHHPVRDGMPAPELGVLGRSRPWSDDAGGACVEVLELHDGRVAVRQSTDPEGAGAGLHAPGGVAFVTGVEAGEADFLL
ncbi:DUF397 domain-containing protein [Streptomyces cinereospinus]|uniref:DUF397 domain-containing protein n=1 Tax=Streptomyces cinereospinus TaxID=285561 RepID=A0ABV5MWD8_9ACTN